jgi:hypothetical protein
MTSPPISISLAAHSLAPGIWSRECPLCDSAHPVTLDLGHDVHLIETCPHFDSVDKQFERVTFRFVPRLAIKE